MKRAMAVVATVGAALVLMAGPAMAATTGPQTFVLYGQDDTPGTIVGSGPVSGVGVEVDIDEDNAIFSFSNGAFHVNHPQTGGSDNFNPTTCSGSATFSGPYTLSGGSGAYTGVTGSGTYSGRAVFVGQRDSTGACSEDLPPLFSFFYVVARGTTTLP